MEETRTQHGVAIHLGDYGVMTIEDMLLVFHHGHLVRKKEVRGLGKFTRRPGHMFRCAIERTAEFVIVRLYDACSGWGWAENLDWEDGSEWGTGVVRGDTYAPRCTARSKCTEVEA